MSKLGFSLPPAARWWMTAFFIGVVFSALARRFFPDAMPWSADLPAGTQAGLRLFVGIVVGIALQAVWWAARRAIRQT
jgi:hypothetical protein